nr:MAG TPA: protein of unknown function (DUF4748) [Bacteriophage sp.]
MKERLKDIWKDIKARPIYFVICVLWFIVITAGIVGTFTSCRSINKDYKTQSNTYVQIRMPDGNIIAGYADKVTLFNDNYATITIGNTRYKTSPYNFILIEEKS